jgi:nucleotide-binding universal stress UspA family protein
VAQAVAAVVLVEPGQVELVDDVEQEEGEVAARELLVQARWHQVHLVALGRQEVVRHSHNHRPENQTQAG